MPTAARRIAFMFFQWKPVSPGLVATGGGGAAGGTNPLVLPSACVRGDGRLLFLFGVYDTHSANHTETRAPTPKKATMQIRKPRRKPRSIVNNIAKKPFPFGGFDTAV